MIFISFFYILICALVARLGRPKVIGEWSVFFISLFFTPILGAICASMSKSKADHNAQVRAMMDKAKLDQQMKDQVIAEEKEKARKECNAKMFDRERLEKTYFSLLTDDFTGDKTISLTRVSDQEENIFKIYAKSDSYDCLGWSFVNHNGYVYIMFVSSAFSLATGDSVILLFEGDNKIEYTFRKADSANTNTCPLTAEQLKIFLTAKFKKVKVTSLRKNTYRVYELKNEFDRDYNYPIHKPQYFTEIEGQYLLQYIAHKFIEINVSNGYEAVKETVNI